MPNLAHKLWAITAKVKLKEGDASSATVNQNDSGLIKMKLKNWILLAFASQNETRVMYRHPMKHPFLKRDMKIECFQGQQ